ncbi:interphotoreceptor matrix proteoglycan 1 [Osmerus mordax]|uniref:interphotoreceptor matrix proteoglycan 1 n=1 Tax=Osmerus mordax TaxID=8014 RepID=UPI003510AAA0
MLLRAGLFLTLFLFTLQANRIRDLEGPDFSDIRDVKYRHFLEASRQIKQTTNVKTIEDLARHRTKRSTFFTTGVKVCPQESMKEVITSHRAYYKLRICQEAVWEAFRVFLDRLPSSEEYKHWVHACQHGSLCLDDLARNFSSTQEHLDMVARRVQAAAQEQAERERVRRTANSRFLRRLILYTSQSQTSVEKHSEKLRALRSSSDSPNVGSEELLEQVVEFSITIVDPGYSELLSDPETPQYHDITQELQDKMLHVFDKLPGFKEIRVLGFRSEDVTIRYAVVFDGDSDNGDEAMGALEPGTGTDGSLLKDMVAKALSEETSLLVDIHSLNFELDDTISPVEVLGVTPLETLVSEGFGLPAETEPSLEEGVGPAGGFFPTVAAMEDNSLEAFTVRPHTYTYLPFFPEEPMEEVTGSPAVEALPVPPIQELTVEGVLEEEPSSMEASEEVASPLEVIVVMPPVTTLAALTEQPSTEPNTVSVEEETASPVTPEAEVDEGPLKGPEVASEDNMEELQDDEDHKDQVVPPTASIEEEPEEVDLTEIPAPVEEDPTQPEWVLPLVTELLSAGPIPPPEDDLTQAAEEKEPMDSMEVTDDALFIPEAPEPGSAPHGDGDEAWERAVTPATVEVPRDESDLQEDVEPSEQDGTEATNTLEEDSGSGFPEDEEPSESTAPPAFRHMSTPLMTSVEKSKELVVFFSLRVTNMMFSDDLFNKSSPEYRSLENTFLELTQFSEPRDSPNLGASSKSRTKTQRTLASIPLLPYLQSNLTGFKQLEILNFRNGSVVVNSKMKLDKAVPYNVTQAVHCVLEDFCNAASKRLDIEIDSRSLDIEPADQGDPCKFLACNEFSRCVVNSWTMEAECLCDPGYSTVDGLPCQSICEMEPGYCFNEGLCEIIQGHGATCRCPVGKYWHYHGERCNELVSMPLDPSLIVGCLVGSLTLVSAIIGILIFINKKCIQTRKTVTLVHTLAPYAFENTLRVNPVFENDDGVLTQVSTLECASSSSQPSDQSSFPSIENLHLSIEMPRQLYTTRPDKLVSEMVDFHHCIPHNETTV